MLARFFKPKWQHTKAEVRLRAVTKLSADDPSSSEILHRLALQDQDAGVRRAALERVQESKLLIRASQEDSSAGNRTCALQRITQLASGEQGNLSLQQRLDILPHIQTTELLIHLALNSDNKDLQLQVIALIDDEAALLDLVKQSDNGELKRLAAEKIESQEALEQLERLVRGKDKRINRTARNKLQLLREQQQQQQQRQERQQQLLDSLSQLINSESQPLFNAKLEALNQQWIQQLNEADIALNIQWQQLYQQGDQRRQQQLQVQLEAEQAEQRKQQQRRQREQLQSSLQALLAEPETTIDAATLSGLEQEFSALDANTADAAVEKLLLDAQTLQQAQQQLAAKADEISAVLSNGQQLADHVDSKKIKNLQKKVSHLQKQVNWPAALPQPSPLQQLTALYKQLQAQLKDQQKQRSEQQSQFDSKLDEMESAIGAGEIRQANKLNGIVQNKLNLMSSAQNQRYKQLYADLQELRDWQGYALTPKREALCEQMEALIDDERPLDQRAREIKSLQQQWRDLDATGIVHSRELWQRFKSASDQAYAPCDVHYAAQRDQRQQNLEKRQSMLQQLENYTEQLDWDYVDWKAVEDITRTAKHEWRTYSPVDRAPGKPIQSRFNKLINLLEGKLKAQRKAVQSVKEALLADAEALLDMEDVAEATEQAKALQQRWKDAGTTFRSQERKLWTEFRAHCNALFAKRDEQFQQERQSRQQGYSKLKQLCINLEQLRNQPMSILELEDALNRYNDEYQQLCETENNLNAAQQKQFEQQSTLLRAKLNQRKSLFGNQYQALQRHAVLCTELEDALLNNAVTDDLLSQLQDAWQQGPALPEDYQQLMNARFENAQALCQDASNLAEVISQQEATLRQLCIRLEITLGQPSPDEDQAYRLEYQMQRLQQALVQQKEGFDLADVQKLEFERLCLPFSGYHQALSERFNQLVVDII